MIVRNRCTTVLSIVVALSLCAGCSRAPVSAVSVAAAPVAAASPGPAVGERITGVVLETMNASSYTYVRVKADSRELWAAASQFKTAVGDTVVLSLDQPMEHFHSQTLNRDFDRIYFVSRIGQEDAAPALPLAVAHGDVPPGARATTVAEVWKTRTALAGKNVTIRGTVVKYNGGILGVNWMHIQDGTGSAADGSNDITVTSETDSKVGEVISVTGMVAVNKDLGSGYHFPVIVEHAIVLRK